VPLISVGIGRTAGPHHATVAPFLHHHHANTAPRSNWPAAAPAERLRLAAHRRVVERQTRRGETGRWTPSFTQWLLSSMSRIEPPSNRRHIHTLKRRRLHTVLLSPQRPEPKRLILNVMRRARLSAACYLSGIGTANNVIYQHGPVIRRFGSCQASVRLSITIIRYPQIPGGEPLTTWFIRITRLPVGLIVARRPHDSHR
jgi:hypothetical protein